VAPQAQSSQLGYVLSCVPTISAEDTASTQDKAKVEAGENVYNICQVCHGERDW
jgi:mono/diheme cytochrome c family protein